MNRRLIKVLPFMILFFFILGHIDTAFADAGDFYDRNERHFNDNEEFGVYSDDYIEMLESYDYESNSFDCKWTDFYCKMNSPLYVWAIGLVKASISMGDDAVVSPYDVIGNRVFEQYRSGLGTLSYYMLAIFLVWQVVKIIAMRFAEADDGMIALNEQIIKVVAFSILLGIYLPLFNMIMQFQQYLTEAVLGDPVGTEDIAITVFKYGGGYGFFIAMLIAGIMMIFKIAFVYRFVLFGLLYITGVIAIPTGMNEEYNYFSVWLRLLVTNGVTLFLQALTFTLGVNALIVQNAFNKGTAFVTAMAFFILALTIPAMLGQLGASTGTGRGVGAVVRVATRMRRR